MRQALWNVALVKIARKSTERRPWWILRRFANKELLTKCLVNWATIKNFITCCPGKVAMKNTQFTLCRRIPHNILLYLNLFKFTAWRQFSAIKRLNPIAQSKKRLNRFEEKISYKSIYLWLPILKSLQMIHKYLQARSFSLASNLFFPRKFRSFFFQSLELQCLRFDIWTSLFKKWFDLKIKIRVLVFSDSLRIWW